MAVQTEAASVDLSVFSVPCQYGQLVGGGQNGIESVADPLVLLLPRCDSLVGRNIGRRTSTKHSGGGVPIPLAGGSPPCSRKEVLAFPGFDYFGSGEKGKRGRGKNVRCH